MRVPNLAALSSPFVIPPRTVCSWAPMRPATPATVVVRSETAAELGEVESIAVVGRQGVKADGELFPLPEQCTTWQRRVRVFKRARWARRGTHSEGGGRLPSRVRV